MLLKDEVAWYESTDGLGTFSEAHVLDAVMSGPVSVCLHDLNGDSFLDAVIAVQHDGIVDLQLSQSVQFVNVY